MSADPKVTPSSSRVVRDPAFAQRLIQACDASVNCPPPNYGRQTWIAETISKKMKTKKISAQTVSRWFAGEAKPRRDKSDVLADMLGVDPVWLYMGVDQDLSLRERRARNALADGAVNLVAGLVQMDGGVPAFPDKGDARAEREHIDLYAVIKGVNYAFHVAMGNKTDEGWQFVVPLSHEGVLLLGVVREGFSFRIIELTEEIIAEHGTRSSRSVYLNLSDDMITAKQVTSFAQRL